MRTVAGVAIRGSAGGGGGGISWVDPVLDKDLSAPPGGPVYGDRYIVAAGGSGLWTGKDDNIAEWGGSTWSFTPPVAGMTCVVLDENETYMWNGSSWGQESFGPHAATHEDGGSDEISIAGLAGESVTPQPPKAHAASHADGAADELLAEALATAGEIDSAPVSDGAGGLDMRFPDAATVRVAVRKGTPGPDIQIGEPVYITGWNVGLNVLEVELADSASAATMPAIGVAPVPITNSANAHVHAFGNVDGFNTSSWSAGDPLYIASGGGLTNVKPTGTALIQKIAEVLRSHATLGEILVFGAGRSNDLPNLSSAQIWKGDGSGVPQAVAFAHAADHQDGGSDEVATVTAAAGAIPKADGGGKIPIGFIPDSVIGGAIYQGTWNANTNTPTLANTDVGENGHYWKVDTAGSTDFGAGAIAFNIGDWAINNGTIWEKVDNTDQVVSVHGRQGAVVAAQDDYAHSQNSGIGVDDHHAQLHAAQHQPGGGDAMAVDGAVGVGSLRTLGAGAQQAAAGDDDRMAWVGAQVYYVRKGGSDSADGKSVNRAFLTIGKAITEIGLATPSTTNRFVINVMDAGVITEDLVMPDYTILNAPSTKLIGKITAVGLLSHAVVILDSISSSANDAVTTNGKFYLHVKHILTTTGAGVVVGAGQTYFDVDLIECVGAGIGVDFSVASGNGYGAIGRIKTDGTGVRSNAAGCVASLTVGEIAIADAAGKGVALLAGATTSKVHLAVGFLNGVTSATAIDVDDAKATLIVGEIAGFTQAYNVSGSAEMHLIVGKIAGSEIDGSTGDVQVSRAGGVLNPNMGANLMADGMKSNDQVGEAVAFGELLYMKSDAKYWKADADAAATMPAVVMALATISADAVGPIIHKGYVRNDSWSWTIGGLIYASATGGALTQTAPSGTGDQVQVVGYAVTADHMFFDPQLVMVEVA